MAVAKATAAEMVVVAAVVLRLLSSRRS
jgi:hypothetical protein